MSMPLRIGFVGRPNVGKSTLFNRLLGSRQAIVADQAGTTRDRLESLVELDQSPVMLVDMAGIELRLHQDDELNQNVQQQITVALEAADVLVWVVDGQMGPTPQDGQLSLLLRRLGKPVIIAVNKSDSPQHDVRQFDFAEFGFPMVTLSAIHGRGINDLVTVLSPYIQQHSATTLELPSQLSVSIVGRPNVGKSTLLNALLGQVRSVVSPVAGTTRDSVDTIIPAHQFFGSHPVPWKTVRLVDTAGVRRRGKIGHDVEAWSVLRTLDSLERGDVALCLIDATEGLVHQDLQVFQQIVDAGRAAIIVVNKWDTILAKKDAQPGSEQDAELQERFLDTLRRQAPFIYWIQVLFISAQTDINLQYVARVILEAAEAWSAEYSPEELNHVTTQLQCNPRFKNLLGITLQHSCPPVFHLHVEGKALPHFSTLRAAENTLRDSLNIGPTIIKIWAETTLPKSSRRT